MVVVIILTIVFYTVDHTLPNTQVGQAAVPINMTILGINLSSTFQKKKSKKNSAENTNIKNEKAVALDNCKDCGSENSKMLSNKTMLAVVIGKMIVMPVIGVVSTWFLQRYYIDLPDGTNSR